MARATGPGKAKQLPIPSAFLLFNFDVDGAALKPEHERFLRQQVTETLRAGGSVSVVGLTDRTGSAQHNQALSEKRAANTVAFLRREVPNGFNVRQETGFGERIAAEKGDADDTTDDEFRAVQVFLSTTPKPPDPTPVPPAPPPPPPVATVGKFQIDLLGWIPQPEIDNPLAILPSFIKSLLPAGMADPFFGGDNFVTPGLTPAATRAGHTFRATQSLSFDIPSWGAPPVKGLDTASPGLTTCLSARRSAGGVVTFSMAATVLRSSASVAFSSSDNWYEIELSGAVQDPVPAAAAAALAAKIPRLPALVRPVVTAAVAQIASKATPTLTWTAIVRIQKSSTIDPITRASYVAFSSAETSGSISGASTALGPGSGLVHGRMTFSQWPSAAIYLTFTPSGGRAATQPIYFTDASSSPKPETAFILVPKLSKTRQLTW